MATKKSPGPTVTEFLAQLPDERRAEIKRVRDVVRRNIPKGYEEVVHSNMLMYQVPLKRYPDTYNGRPLCYLALASQKGYLTLHLMPVYGDRTQAQRLRQAFDAVGKKLDMGKACIRFKRADDLALDAIGKVVGSYPVDRWIEIAEWARRR